MKNIIIIILAFGFFCFSCEEKERLEKPIDFDQLFDKYKTYRSKNVDSLNTLYLLINKNDNQASNPHYTFISLLITSNLAGLNGELDKSITAGNKTIAIAKDVLKLDSLECLAHNSIGNLYKNNSEFDKSYLHFIKADSIYQLGKIDKSYKSLTQINIAKLFFTKNEPEKAKQIIENTKADGDSTLSNPTGMHLLANYYGQSGQIDNALAIDNLYIEKLEATNEELQLSPFYNNKANCFMAVNKLDSAIHFINKSLAIDLKNGDTKNVGANYLLMAEVYSMQNNLNRSNEYLFQARDIFLKYNHQKNLFDTYTVLKKNAITSNDLKAGLAYADSLAVVNTRINGFKINSKLDALNIEYQASLKNKELDNQKIKVANYKMILLLLSLLLLTSILAYWQRSLQMANKLKLTIKDAAQKSTLAILDAEQKLKLRIAGDLHDSLGQKLTALKMYSEKSNESIQYRELLDDVIIETRNIAHDLKPDIISLGLIPSLDQIFSIIPPHVKVKVNIDEEFDKKSIGQDKILTLYRCVQEACNNAMKHSKCTAILVELKLRNDAKYKYKLSIGDNGIGMDSTGNFTGMGLVNIKTRMQVIKGEVHIKKGNPGTTIELLFND